MLQGRLMHLAIYLHIKSQGLSYPLLKDIFKIYAGFFCLDECCNG